MSNIRKRRIKRHDNKELRNHTHSNFDAAFDRVIAAMRCIDEGHIKEAKDHLHRTAEHLVELRALSNETKKRYQNSMKATRHYKERMQKRGDDREIVPFPQVPDWLNFPGDLPPRNWPFVFPWTKKDEKDES
jgi:hypothetical protein